MHPKQICKDVESMGSRLVLDGNDLFIENPENIYPEAEEVIVSYKSRIITYLKGEYTDEMYNVHQTIDKVLLFMSGVNQDMNEKINNWLNEDVTSITMVMQLTIDLHKNGWSDSREPSANYETKDTYKLSYDIYRRAMTFFKGN